MNNAQIFGTVVLTLYLLNSYLSSYVQISPPHDAVYGYYRLQQGKKFEEDVRATEEFLKSEISLQGALSARYTKWSIRPHYRFTTSKRDFHHIILWKAIERIFHERLDRIVLEHSPLFGLTYHYTVYLARDDVKRPPDIIIKQK